MSPYSLFSIIVFLLSFFSHPLFADNFGNCQGTITNSMTLLPINNASIQLLDGGGVVVSTFSNPLGFYEFLNIKTGNYTLTVSASGFATFSFGVQIKKNQTTVADVQLTPSVTTGTIEGTVSVNGLVPPDFNLTSVSLYQNSILLAVVQTDNFGVYSFPDLSPGNYVVKASYPTCVDQLQSVFVTTGATTIVNFPLVTAPRGSIDGHVEDIDGLNVSGALIDIILDNNIVASTAADINGDYAVSNLPYNTYIVHCTSPDYQAQIRAVTLSTPGPDTVDFVLNPNPGTLQGIVRDNLGTPLAGALIEVNYNNILVFQTLTDLNGAYIFEGLPLRTFQIHAHDNGYQSGIANAVIVSSQTTILNFNLFPGPALLNGKVTDALTANPVAGAVVELNLNNVGVYSVLTDANGDYAFLGVAPGDYVVHVHAKTYQTDIEGITLSVGSNTKNFAVEAAGLGAIQGQVLDASTGLPINNGVFIQLYIGFIDSFYFLDALVGDQNGDYSFTGLDPAYTYKIVANKYGYTSQTSSALSVLTPPVTQDFQLEPMVEAPTNLQGQVLVNQSALQVDRIHKLMWNMSPDINTASYRIYRNNQLLSDISYQGPFVFEDHYRSFKNVDNYKVVSVSTMGNEGFSESVSLR